MFNDRCKRDRNDGNDCCNKKACIKVAACEDIENSILIMERQADPCCVLDVFDACFREKLEIGISCDCVITVNRLAAGNCKDDAEQAGSDYSEEDRDDLDHALAPDVANDDDEDCNDGNKPVR